MKKLFLLSLTLIGLISCSRDNSIAELGLSSIKLVSLPLDFNSIAPINTSEKLENNLTQFEMDTLFLQYNSDELSLGKELEVGSSISLRIKATFTDKNGSVNALYLARSGLVLFEGVTYTGSFQTKQLIEKVDSSKINALKNEIW